MTITLRPYQQEAKNKIYQSWQSGNRNVCAVLPTGAGKCYGRDTQILMYDGNVKSVQDINVGDFLIGPDSLPRVVLNTCKGFDDLYEVKPVKGDSYIINSQHILSLKKTGEKANDSDKGKIVNIDVQTYLSKTKYFKHIHKGWRSSVDFTTNEVLPFDPYMLGVWLGDGTSTIPAITTPDEEIKKYCEAFALKNDMIISRREVKDNCETLFFTKPVWKPRHKSYFGKFLSDYDLVLNKHIPHVFKTASREDRLQLLAGLIDTDGHLSHSGCDIIFKQERLLDDLIFIARSLGFSAYKTKCQKTCTNTGAVGWYYRCNINGDLSVIPNKIEYKKSDDRKQIKNVLVTGVTVKYAGYGEYFGFELVGPDRLHLLGDFTVSHNSVIISDIIQDGYRQGMSEAVIAHRNELVTQMSCHIAARGIPHRIIGSNETIKQCVRKHREKFNKSFHNPSARTAVVGVDTLVARRESLVGWAKQIDRWTIDECFPAGTKISVKNGHKNIEDINIGEHVWAFDEHDNTFKLEKVTKLFKNPIHEVMVRLTTEEHHVIELTCGHPVWTQRGWVKAINIKESDKVLNVEKGAFNSRMYGLRGQRGFRTILSTKNIQRHRASVLQQRMFNRISTQNLIRNYDENQSKICIGTDEEKQSHASQAHTTESFSNTQSYGSSTQSTWWKRQTTYCSRTKISRFNRAIRFRKSTHCKNRGFASSIQCTKPLQNRFSTSTLYDCYRSRRQFTQHTNKTRSGSQKRSTAEFVGLESVEVFQLGSDGKDRGNYVYNIEVDTLHTYIANDLVVHNCHHLLCKNKWGKAVDMMPNAYGLGVTATPIRADGQGLGRNFDGFMDDIILGPSMRWLIENEYLAEYEIVCPTSDLQVEEEVKSANGDWSSQYLKKAARKSKIVGDVVENYIRWAIGRKAICFATDIETAGNIAHKFNEFGIRAAALSSETPSTVREKYLKEFELGILTVLVNVDLFDEGFDVGDCEVCIMARPTASLGKYLQQIGRVLRPYPGKVALIIDHVSNVIRHKLPDMMRPWTLARRDKRGKSAPDPEDIPLTRCLNPTCLKPYRRFLPTCPYCGTSKPLPAPRERSIEMVEGDLILLDREMLERMRAATQLENPADVASRVQYATGNAFAAKGVANRQIEKIEEHSKLRDALAQWAGIQRAEGLSDREIQKRFYLTVGYDVLSALDASKSRADMQKIREMIESWYDPR